MSPLPAGYEHIEHSVYLLMAVVFVVWWLRDKIVPRFSKESLLAIFICTFVNYFIISPEAGGLAWLFNQQEAVVADGLQRYHPVVAGATSMLGIVLFSLAKAYVWTMQSYHILLYLPFFLFYLLIASSKRPTPLIARVVIVLGSYVVIGLFACLLFVANLHEGQFGGLAQLVSVYQLITCLAAFLMLTDLIPTWDKKTMKCNWRDDMKFYASRYVDDSLSYVAAVTIVLIYAISYPVLVIGMGVSHVESNLYAVVFSLTACSLYRSYRIRFQKKSNERRLWRI